MDIGGWLRSLSLEQYEAAFRENAITEKVLPNLTAEDLKDLGVGVVGHRRTLLDAIAFLRAEMTTKAPAPEAPSSVPKPSQDTAKVSLGAPVFHRSPGPRSTPLVRPTAVSAPACSFRDLTRPCVCEGR